MIQCDVVITGTTYATTAYIPLPAGFPPIAYMPTTQFIQGGGGLLQANAKANTTTTVQINRTAVKYNVLKLRYRAVGEIVRT